MRKLNNPMPSGGAPFTNEDLNDVFQTEIWAVVQAMLSRYDAETEGVIVSGCVVTPNGSNFDMTAGIVYLNGEFMRVDAVTNQSFTKYIKASSPTNVSRVFNDTVSKTFIIEKKAQVSATVDGAGQEITISSVATANDRRIGNLVDLATSSKFGLGKLYNDLSSSNTDGSITQAGLNTLFSGLLSNWQVVSLSNTDIKFNGITSATTLAFGEVQYRITNRETFITIVFRGASWSSTNFASANPVSVIIPAAIRNIVNQQFTQGGFNLEIQGVATSNVGLNNYFSVNGEYDGTDTIYFHPPASEAFGTNPSITLTCQMICRYIS